MRIPNIFKLIDLALSTGISKRKLERKIEDYKTFRDHPSNVFVLEEFSSLDAKSNSLLQHVSIMIASLSISYAINPPESIKVILLINGIFYLIVVLMTLRVIAYVDLSSEAESGQLELIRELKIRERYYLIAHSLASLLTTFLVAAVVVTMIYYK